MKPRFEPGQRFNRLVVVRMNHVHVTSGGKKKPMMMCRCDCGNDCVAGLYDMRNGRTKSCGCLSLELAAQLNRRHGAASAGCHTPEYKTWRNMLTRGRNPNISHADRYVLRGITVCNEWLPGDDGKGFERFVTHVGPKPSPHHSLDRIDNDKGYEPGNVRWATPSEQLNNQSRTVRLSISGKTIALQDAAKRFGISPRIILQRIRKLGWSHERAVSVPPKPDKRRAA